MSRGLRVGVFGGTFDPPHIGHVVVARQVADHARLDRVVWVPARISPHKLDSAPTPGTVRREMVEAVAGLDPRFSVSTLELEREGPSYTVDTLAALTAEHPDWALFLILGADQIAAFDTWKDPKEIGRMSTLLVVERDGETPDLPAGVDSVAMERIPVTRVDISASGLRRRIADNRSIRHMVPDAIGAIIEREQLYRA